ncbi:hypothetical protein PYJP_07120 [Pyrofollis japonicus]|uniref:hypothetical protein n=1 Tax=Pyrofollis japonicus TaxID=3060460 RepID=UPI00295B9A3B|nr:hypothetical protein [Pyrofollis japonicus]BEP17360.1 hypothetical protein PYJP_07120 [Pyrofollis japonicus]
MDELGDELIVRVNTQGYRPRIRACIRHVPWHCRIKDNTTVSDICVEWTADNKSLEYNALDNLVRSIASSKQWSAEELIAELKQVLEQKLGTQVTVTMRFEEKKDLEIELTLGK